MTNHVESKRALRTNGWVVGASVSFAVIVLFTALFRGAPHLRDELLLVVIPTGVAIGAAVGLAVEGRNLSKRRRNTIGLSVVIGFAVYVSVLVLYLASRA